MELYYLFLLLNIIICCYNIILSIKWWKLKIFSLFSADEKSCSTLGEQQWSAEGSVGSHLLWVWFSKRLSEVGFYYFLDSSGFLHVSSLVLEVITAPQFLPHGIFFFRKNFVWWWMNYKYDVCQNKWYFINLEKSQSVIKLIKYKTVTVIKTHCLHLNVNS